MRQRDESSAAQPAPQVAGHAPAGVTTRRQWLARLPLAAGLFAHTRRAGAAPRGGPMSRDRLVVLCLRGGADGLALVPPHGDPDLAVLRPTLAPPPPGAGPDAALDLDGYFGLAPALEALLPAWQAGELCIVHAVGLPVHERSHFAAQAILERGGPLPPPGTTSGGFLARWLERVPATGAAPLRALALDPVPPQSLAGASSMLAIADPAGASFPGAPAAAQARREALAAMYGGLGGPLEASAGAILDSVGELEHLDLAGYVPSGGAVYPQSSLGRRLRAIAALFAAGFEPEVCWLDVPGFDLHANQGDGVGPLATLARDLAESLAAFRLDLGPEMGRTVVIALSEFGRRAAENASGGTDHGFGGVQFLLGGGIAGGRVIADPWPGLSPASLVDGDLAVTCDWRDVVGEVLVRRCGLTEADLDHVFPGHRASFAGVTAG